MSGEYRLQRDEDERERLTEKGLRILEIIDWITEELSPGERKRARLKLRLKEGLRVRII